MSLLAWKAAVGSVIIEILALSKAVTVNGHKIEDTKASTIRVNADCTNITVAGTAKSLVYNADDGGSSGYVTHATKTLRIYAFTISHNVTVKVWRTPNKDSITSGTLENLFIF